MTEFKKILSFFLCAVMLFGTAVTGFTGASATYSGIAKYEDLAETYDNFVYIATEYYDAAGKLLTGGETFYQGDVITAKFYMKSDLDIHQFNNYVLYPKGASVLKVSALSSFSGTTTYTVGDIKYNAARIYSTKTGSFNASSDEPVAVYTVTVPNNSTVLGKDFGEYIPDIYEANNTAAYITVGKSKAYSKDFTLLINSTDKNNPVIEKKYTGKVSNLVRDIFIDGKKTEYGYHIPETFDDSGIGYAVTPPKGSTAFAWIAENDFDMALNPFEAHKYDDFPVTYVSVSGDTEINVTIDPKEYIFTDGSTTPKNVTVKLSDGLNVDNYALKDAENIGWKITADFAEVNGLATGVYKFRYIDNYTLEPMELDTITLKVANLNREWIDFATIKGVKGTRLSDGDLITLQKYINENYDKLAEIIGFEPLLGSTTVYAKQLSTEAANRTAFSADGKSLYADDLAEVTFGTNTTIYLNTMMEYTYNMYITQIEDDKIVADNEGKFGKAWNLVTTKKATINSVNAIADAKGNTVYANADDITYRIFKITEDEVNAVVRDLNKYTYSYSYKSGNGDKIVINNDGVIFGRIPDCTKGLYNTIEFYIDVDEKTYTLSAACSAKESDVLNKGASQRDSLLSLKFGDTISLDSFSFDGFTIEDMMEDGSVVNNVGYRLKRIYLNDIDLTAGDTVKIDADFIDNADYKGKLVFLTEWEAVPNKFTVYYQNSNKEWNVLVEKVFFGNEDVTADKIYNDILKQAVINDCHESVVPVFDRILAQPGAASSVSVKASEGPMNLYVAYKATERYLFTDYNNDKETEKRFTCSAKLYGTQLYDPNLEGVATTSSPFINYFEVSVAPSSIPDKRQDVDKVTGEPLYEYLYETVLDEQGNPVIDPVTGQEKRQVVLDEFGYKVYDKTKPVYVDKKGDESEHRPYRNCEYIGYKVFYVDGVYTNAADLPAESEWKEGYNANGGDDYGIYGTVIVQYQWKSDKDFLFRVYDANGKIFSALGKNLKWYYWNGDKPCDKKTARLNSDPEQMILMMLPKKEIAEFENGMTATCFYFQAFTRGTSLLNPAFIPNLLVMLVSVIKGFI